MYKFLKLSTSSWSHSNPDISTDSNIWAIFQTHVVTSSDLSQLGGKWMWDDIENTTKVSTVTNNNSEHKLGYCHLYA